jgi:hypothetical protein
MSKNHLVVGKGGNLSSRAGGAEQFTPSVYSLKSNPVDVGRNQSRVMELSMGTKSGGNALGSLQGRKHK